ncbi:archease [Eudoraea sp.]|uniref:archease n=1 Tax=Eudoraea sp. TaxID=1979955 RepID=UPI003C76298A
MKIRFLPHTADIRMKIEGSSLEELFTAGVLGMGNILKDGFCDKNGPFVLKLKIELTAHDETCLLIDFLSEVLSSSYAEKAIFCEIKILELTTRKIRAEIHGRQAHGFDEEIKAVTYHEADVQKNNNRDWETLIIFDI